MRLFKQRSFSMAKLFKVEGEAGQEQHYELHLPDGTIDRIKESKLRYQFESDCIEFIRQNDQWPLEVERGPKSFKYSHDNL
jgi:hypothetical protein